MSLPEKSISPNEIQFLIKKLFSDNAPRNELIINKILKNLFLKTLTLLIHIYNAKVIALL